MTTQRSVEPPGELVHGVNAPGRARIAARTLRGDRWWMPQLVTGTVLALFAIYATIRAFQNGDYYSEPYLTPLYSPCLGARCVPHSSDFGTPIGHWFPLSPAIIVLIFPLGFRLTCYYYRKAYYRAFWLSPPACAVAEPHSSYTGETRFPLILQNIHRYFWYVAMLFCLILSYDAILGFRNEHGKWGHMGLGTVVLVINAVLIWAYTLSCHSCRHITGGRLRHFSKHPIRYWMWTKVSWLNARHMQLAWVSLVWLVVADLYIFLLAHGSFSDPRFF
ncbi:MAG TPA: hypothetical protein VJ851_17165 [Jatrophihabitans sp.]|nr:hypothetical protein [Jatrophihabitans sp.]